MSSDFLTLTPTEALQSLEERRRVLQRLIAVAGSIESLKVSIAHIIAQGEASESENPRMSVFIEGLGRKVRNLSDADVVLRLRQLDRRLKQVFERITPLIERIAAGHENPQVAHIEDDISLLKRLAQASLAIRGLLGRRGKTVPELRLPLNQTALKSRLLAIAAEETRARRSVIAQVREIGSDIGRMLKREDCPQVMKATLTQMYEGLRRNLAHLREGKSVLDLPLPIESASFLETSSTLADLPLVEEEGQPEDSEDEAGSKERYDPGVIDMGAGRGSTNGVRPSLVSALLIWLFAPWRVTWEEVRSGQYRP